MIDRNITGKNKQKELREALKMDETRTIIRKLVEEENKETLKEKDKIIEEKNKELEEKKKELEEKNKELEEKNKELEYNEEKHKKELEEKNKELEYKDKTIKEYDNIVHNENIDEKAKINVLSSLIIVK